MAKWKKSRRIPFPSYANKAASLESHPSKFASQFYSQQWPRATETRERQAVFAFLDFVTWPLKILTFKPELRPRNSFVKRNGNLFLFKQKLGMPIMREKVGWFMPLPEREKPMQCGPQPWSNGCQNRKEEKYPKGHRNWESFGLLHSEHWSRTPREHWKNWVTGLIFHGLSNQELETPPDPLRQNKERSILPVLSQPQRAYPCYYPILKLRKLFQIWRPWL